MRICLLYPPRPGVRGTNLVPPIGLLYIGAVLEQSGHEIFLVDAARTGFSGKKLITTVSATQPELLIITAFTSDIPVLKRELQGLRQSLPNTGFWLGGPHPSSMGVKVFSEIPQIDIVFMGEGEESVLEAINYLNGAPLPEGIITRSEKKNTHSRHIKDLSSLPIPAWHLAPPALYRGLPNGVVLRKTPYAPIITTRGCPYHCTFCAGYRITGRKIRHRPLEQVWEEIELLVGKYGVKEIHIEDDNFTLDRNYAAEFCRIALKKNLPVLFSTPNGVRLDSLDDELVNLMKRAGWYVLHCGVESGSDRILKSIKKAITISEIEEKIKLIHQHGLPVAGYFILGLPGETDDDINRTIKFARESRMEWAHFASFLPIPGSEAGDRFLKNSGWSIEQGWNFFHNTACPAPPEGITAKKIKYYQRKAFLLFYLRPAALFRIFILLLRRGTSIRLIKRFFAYLFLKN